MSKEEAALPTFDAAIILSNCIANNKPLKDIDRRIAICLLTQPRQCIPRSSSHPLVVKFKELLQEVFKDYYYQTSCEFLCAKVFPSGNKQHQVQTCQTCRKQSNGVFCLECFDPSKHEGHKFHRKFIKGGICDCGDSTKWNIDTFCQKHSFLEKIDQCNLSETQMTQFKQDSQHLLKILCLFYEKFLELKDKCGDGYQDMMRLQGLQAICDTFGDSLFQQLTNVNLNRSVIKKLTIEMLKTRFSPRQLLVFIKCISPTKDIPLRKALMTFIDLPKTSEKCSNLIMLILYGEQQLREEFTIDFIKAYSSMPGFATSPYRDLSPQLLSNSRLISKLAKEDKEVKEVKMSIFALPLIQLWPKTYSKVQLKAKEIYQKYSNFITDMIYLIKLSPECAVDYWSLVIDKKWIIDMASYTHAFSSNPTALSFFNQQYYDLQHRFLLKFIRVLDLFCKNDNLFQTGKKNTVILRNLIIALFGKMASCQERGQKDLLFTYERMWAISVYIFLLFQNKQSNFRTAIQDQREYLFKDIYSNYRKDALKMVKLLFERLLQYFVKIDLLIYKKEEQINWQKFKHTYFHSDNILSSIDAIYFRCLLRLGQYIYKKQASKFFHDHLDMFVQKINRQLRILSDNIKASFSEQNDRRSGQLDMKMQVTLGSLLGFVSRLQEVIYSQLPDICLSCKFQAISQRDYYRKACFRYYGKLVRSLGRNERLNIEEFTKLAKFLLFGQEDVLEQFKKQLKTQIITNNSYSIGEKINFHYFHSLKLKLFDFELPSLKVPLCSDLFEEPVTIGSQILKATSAFQTVSYWLKELLLSYQITDYWGFFVHNLIQALWTLSFFTRTFKFQQQFQKLQISHINKACFMTFVPSNMKSYLCQLNPQLKILSNPLSQLDDSDDDLSDEQIKKRYGMYDNQDFSQPIPKINTHVQPQYQFITQELKLCTFCDGNGPDNLYKFCFVIQTQFPPVLGIQQGQSVLSFTSCNHFTHLDCYQNQQKKNPRGECPECRSTYNILLPPLSVMNKWQEPRQFNDNVYLKIKKAIKKTKSSKLSKQLIGGKIFKAILAFLAMVISAKNPKGILRDNIDTYKRLFHLISNELKVSKAQSNHFKQNISNYLVKTSRRQHKIMLFPHLFQALAVNLSPIIKFDDFNRNFYELPPFMQDFLGTLFQGLVENENHKPKPYVNQGLDELSLMPLENGLESLYANHYGVCPCAPAKKKDVFFICLLHKGSKQIYKYCDSCHLSSMRKHIENHKGREEAICVRTDNGEIFYFNVQQGKYRVLNLPSIYTNTLEQKFSLRGKSKQKKNFCLNKAHYTKLCQNFYTGKFKIDSRLIDVGQA